MKRMRKWIRILSYVAGLIALFGIGVGVGRLTGDRTTTSRLSPDETIRARLVETSPWWAPDRSVRVQLDSLIEGTTTVLYASPDEGRPEGTERLIWSKDGAWLLLVGRHFFVKEDLYLDNGDQAYFLYHLPSGKAWLNSAASSPLPALKARAIDAVEFTVPVNQKK